MIRRADLERLALHDAGPSVSLFLPTHRAGPEVQQAPIRLKNLLREATEALQADGVRPPMVDSVLAPLWRRVNTYPHLVDPVFAGNPEELGLHELHARAWAVVEPLFLEAQGEAVARYQELAGTGMTSRDGRIEVLFAARHPTGNGNTNRSPSPNGARALRDVLEQAAVTTLLKGGTVYALPADAVPDGGSAAAVLRYPARIPQDRIG